ncbi:uncharacterized protein LOC110847339 isoform X3 [Folsomia candida]|nr:uncharacterized protein LOC110847339 isoform X3 [Folsomia candida]
MELEENEELIDDEDEESEGDDNSSSSSRERPTLNVKIGDTGKTIAGVESSQVAGSPKDFFLKESVSLENTNKTNNFHQQVPQNSSRPTKTFEEMCRLEDLKQRKKGYTGSKTTIDDFEFKSAKSQRNQNQSKPMDKSVVLISLAVVIILSFVAYMSPESSTASNSQVNGNMRTWEDSQKKLVSDILQLQKQFPSQYRESLIHILSAIDSTLSRVVPKQPSSIVLLVPPKLAKSSFPLCFAQKLSKLTNEIFSEMNGTDTPSTFTMDSKYFQKYGKDITKIHDQLNNYFLNGGRSIIVQDVEKLQDETHLLVFHGLCDNYYAPEKRATLLFILPVPQNLFTTSKLNNGMASELSYQILDQGWKSTTNDDSRPAMIARIAASVVFLNEGDSCN